MCQPVEPLARTRISSLSKYAWLYCLCLLKTRIQSLGWKSFICKDSRQTLNWFLYLQPPETKQAQCRCGWEHLIGQIQEGFVAALIMKGRYGFITKDLSRDRKARGIYFNDSHLRGFSFEQLRIGDRVYFLVGQNDRSCVAQQIDVVGKTPIPVTQVFICKFFFGCRKVFIDATYNKCNLVGNCDSTEWWNWLKSANRKSQARGMRVKRFGKL